MKQTGVSICFLTYWLAGANIHDVQASYTDVDEK